MIVKEPSVMQLSLIEIMTLVFITLMFITLALITLVLMTLLFYKFAFNLKAEQLYLIKIVMNYEQKEAKLISAVI